MTLAGIQKFDSKFILPLKLRRFKWDLIYFETITGLDQWNIQKEQEANAVQCLEKGSTQPSWDETNAASEKEAESVSPCQQLMESVQELVPQEWRGWAGL